MTAKYYLGTQGWSYKDWVGSFYPAGTQARDFLSRYAQMFDAVELDTTFYATPPLERVQLWRQNTPDHFQFTAKMPRGITHDKRLLDAEADAEEFMEVMSALGQKLGAVLIQLPPDFGVETSSDLDAFLASLPSGFNYAVELRHRSWLRDETFTLLERHHVAWTMVDLWYMPRRVEVTAGFTYVRWLGKRREIERVNETQIDRRAQLQAWAEVLDSVATRTQRIYGFANNHYSGHSPADIRYLHSLLGLETRSGSETDYLQGELL